MCTLTPSARWPSRAASSSTHLQVDRVRLAAPADVLREGQPQQPGLAELREHLAREALLPLVGRGVRGEFGVGQLAGQRDQVGGLLGGQFAVDRHGAPWSENSTEDGTAVLSVVQAVMLSACQECDGGGAGTTSTATGTALTRRQAQLLDQLEELFLAEGFARFTLDDLAVRLHCSKSTLYALADSKEQLALRVIRHFFRKATVASRRGRSPSRTRPCA